MILADASLWVDFIRNPIHRAKSRAEFSSFVICGPIFQEVIQGLNDGQANAPLRSALLALPRPGDPLMINTFGHAADIFSQGRRRGFTIRSSYACLIAAIAIQNDVVVWHRDRDYTHIAGYTALKQVDKRFT